MENQPVISKKHKFVCDDRKSATINGVIKVDSTSETQVVCEINGSMLVVLGKNLHVKKLDINESILEIEGQIDQMRYTEKSKPFFKRLFK